MISFFASFASSVCFFAIKILKYVAGKDNPILAYSENLDGKDRGDRWQGAELCFLFYNGRSSVELDELLGKFHGFIIGALSTR